MEIINIQSKMIKPLSEGNQRSVHSCTFYENDTTMCACCICDPNTRGAGDITATRGASTMNDQMVAAGSVAIRDILSF